MTHEEELLLIKEISARLSYGLKVNFISIDHICTVIGVVISSRHPRVELDYGPILLLKHIKPYLRPLSSMTEEEEKEYENCFQSDDTTAATLLVDFYNKHHFDYRGLIENGLAIEAPEGMYEKI